MKPENQACSLELAKRLKELNCPQESLFWWVNTAKYNHNFNLVYRVDMTDEMKYGLDCYSAFTVAELGELPDKYKITLSKYSKICVGLWELDKKWGKECFIKNFEADTEADARAEMWLWLKENKLL